MNSIIEFSAAWANLAKSGDHTALEPYNETEIDAAMTFIAEPAAYDAAEIDAAFAALGA